MAAAVPACAALSDKSGCGLARPPFSPELIVACTAASPSSPTRPHAAAALVSASCTVCSSTHSRATMRPRRYDTALSVLLRFPRTDRSSSATQPARAAAAYLRSRSPVALASVSSLARGASPRISPTSHSGTTGIAPSRNASARSGASPLARHAAPSGRTAPGATTKPPAPRTQNTLRQLSGPVSERLAVTLAEDVVLAAARRVRHRMRWQLVVPAHEVCERGYAVGAALVAVGSTTTSPHRPSAIPATASGNCSHQLSTCVASVLAARCQSFIAGSFFHSPFGP